MLRATASVGLAVAARAARGQDAAADAAPDAAPDEAPGRVFYYVDGYHGGIDGHMPPDSLRNVLDGLDRFPTWKVTFEIEPYSWAAFAKSDPEAVARLKRLLADATPAARVEIVSGAYGQPYAWNASGESNIRQIAYGLAELRAALPGAVVDTYAVQEPCWTSCLPQLLQSFGYRRAVMKNSTCWGGYHAPMLDADLVHWVGPDGSRITAVPRYTMEGLVPPATTLGSQPTAAFIDRCVEAGIEHPAGSTLQDMGWPGRPWRFGMEAEAVRAMKHVTWREYVDTVASPPVKEWKASQEDLRVGLPWGASVLQRIAQGVRAGENALVRAEKMASMAFVRRGRPFPREELDEAWRQVLWSQHHDAWIVSSNRHRDGTWASAADEKCESSARTCERIVGGVAASMTVAPEVKGPERSVRVFNTTGFRRRDLASVEIGAEPVTVFDAAGSEVPCQVIPAAGEGASAALVFPADVPALGYATYRIAAAGAVKARAEKAAAGAVTNGDGTVVLETDLYTLSIDPAKGGRIRSLFAKDMDREFVDPGGARSFNEFRGYFPGKWLTSVEAPAEVRVVESGPLRVAAEIRGRIGPWPFVSVVSLAAGRRRVDFHTTFEFVPDAPPFGRGRGQREQQQEQTRVRIGEPWEPGRDATRSNRRPFYDSTFKLQALFPATLRRPTLDKNAPFDVCRSAISDTRFNAWDAIKNDVVLNWVDLLEEGGAAGLAVMTDHATSYCLTPGEPLGLVMCYAGRGVWHDYGLGRVPRVSYSVVPHAGNWAKAGLWRELARWGEPLVAATGNGPSEGEAEWSLLDASEGGIEVTTAFVEDGDLIVRLFNAEGDATPRRIALDGRVRRVRGIELDGRVIEEVPIDDAGAGRGVTVMMNRFAVRTLRCTVSPG